MIHPNVRKPHSSSISIIAKRFANPATLKEKKLFYYELLSKIGGLTRF